MNVLKVGKLVKGCSVNEAKTFLNFYSLRSLQIKMPMAP